MNEHVQKQTHIFASPDKIYEFIDSGQGGT